MHNSQCQSLYDFMQKITILIRVTRQNVKSVFLINPFYTVQNKEQLIPLQKLIFFTKNRGIPS